MKKKFILLNKLEARELEEGESIEFKECWHQENGKSISSIANREGGGWLIIGVNDQGAVTGFTKAEAKDQKIKLENHISQYLDPVSAVQSISLESVNKRNCLFIEIINPNSVVS